VDILGCGSSSSYRNAGRRFELLVRHPHNPLAFVVFTLILEIKVFSCIAASLMHWKLSVGLSGSFIDMTCQIKADLFCDAGF
jgi:hypothetical protein